jgi:hypothetical protein
MKVMRNPSDCTSAMEWMSSSIDSMATPEESERLQAHVAECEACGRQLQSFISLRNLVAGVEPVAVPEDLMLDTRVKLSRERADNSRDVWKARLDNVLKPFAVPALTGIALTLVGFAVLFSGLASPRAVAAAGFADPMYEPLRTTDPTIRRLGYNVSPELDQPLSIGTKVSKLGQVYEYTIIGGTRSAGVDKWIQETLLLAQFKPATSWGSPVPSHMILSFVNVRG